MARKGAVRRHLLIYAGITPLLTRNDDQVLAATGPNVAPGERRSP